MEVIRQFITDYKRSLRDFSYYSEILSKPFFYSLRFLYLLTFSVLLINTVLFAITAAFYLPSFPGHIESLQSRLSTLYPRNLIIQIDDGKISTNADEPVVIDIPEFRNIAPYAHFAVLDTEATVDDYVELDTVLLITEYGVIYPDINNSVAPYQIERAQNFGTVRIDHEVYQTALTRFNVFLDTLPEVAPWILFASVICIPLFGSIIVTLWRLVILLILTGIMFPISMIFGNTYTYSQLYRMGMHGLVAPVTLTLVLNMMGVSIPLAFASCFLLWMVIVLARIENKPITTQ